MNKPHIYKITNNIDNKFYYGVHCGKNTDSYMGSGLLLKNAQAKHGINNFSKQILMWFDTIEEAYEYEAVIVNEKLVKSKNCYNIALGGNGGRLNNDEEHYRKQGVRFGNWTKQDAIDNPETYKQRAQSLSNWRSDIKNKNEVVKNASKGGKAIAKSPNFNMKKRGKCIYCGKEANLTNLARWHNKNCKHNSNNI